MFGFLRHLTKGQIIFWVGRLLRSVLPLRPYSLCGHSARCPCPAKDMVRVMGLAIGDEVHIRLDSPCTQSNTAKSASDEAAQKRYAA